MSCGLRSRTSFSYSSSSFRLRLGSGCGARLACEADFERLATQSFGFVGQAVLESGRAE
jgi:hypothetical protein